MHFIMLEIAHLLSARVCVRYAFSVSDAEVLYPLISHAGKT